MTTYRTIVLLAVLSGFSALSHGASVELWPADRRLNNTFYCYGDDWNALNFILAAEDQSGTRLEVAFTWHRGEVSMVP